MNTLMQGDTTLGPPVPLHTGCEEKSAQLLLPLPTGQQKLHVFQLPFNRDLGTITDTDAASMGFERCRGQQCT